MTVKISKVNINGLYAHYQSLIRYINTNDIDIICVEEIKCTETDPILHELKQETKSVGFFNSKLGLGIVLRHTALKFKLIEVKNNIHIFQNRLLHIQIMNQEIINIITVYAPSGDLLEKTTFYQELMKYLQKYKHYDIVLLENFNFVMETTDRLNDLLLGMSTNAEIGIRIFAQDIRIYSNIRMIYTSMPSRPITMTLLVVHVLEI